MATCSPKARARTVLFLTTPALWPAWPFLPVVRRCRAGNELRQFIAIACEHRRARRACQHESACHRAEKFLAHDFLDNREAAFEHVHQARDHVVAVHGQASRRNDRAGRTDSDRDRLLTVEQGFGKG